MADSWEERMAKRVRARRMAVYAAEVEQERLEAEAEFEQDVQAHVARLTPESARKEEEAFSNIGCACIGGPLCCRVRFEARRRVLNS